MRKIFSILAALALVLNFSVVATSVSAADYYYAELVANITAPENDTAYVAGFNFTVTANVTCNGTGKAQDVKATIAIGPNAKLKPNETYTKNVITELGANWTRAVNWTLECTGAGAVGINVTPSGIEPNTLNPIPADLIHSAAVTIYQQQILEVTIEPLANDGKFNVTDAFDVTAKVKNISSLNATEVKLTISIDRYAQVTAGAATRTVGDLGSNSTSEDDYIWTVQCTGDGFSRITVSPSGKVGGLAIPPDGLIPGKVRASQGDFVVGNITLNEGWNLISLPLIPLASNTSAVLADILNDVNSVWNWNATAKRWYTFVPGGPSDLPSMKDGLAYWINMKTAQTLNVAGRQMPVGTQLPPAYDVVINWNMVGFKSTDNATALDYLDGTTYVRIYGYKSGEWFLIPGPDYVDPEMEPGLGYWVAFTQPGTIYP